MARRSYSKHPMTEAEEDAWFDEQRARVENYLKDQGCEHGGVGLGPAWEVTPYVSVWAIQSLKTPGKVGWWAISGDLPADYCSGGAECNHPRLAVKHIAETWRQAVADCKPGDATLGSMGIPAEFAELLASRAQMLLEWVDDPGLWPD